MISRCLNGRPPGLRLPRASDRETCDDPAAPVEADQLSDLRTRQQTTTIQRVAAAGGAVTRRCRRVENRRIAAAVFSDARYRGRVERIRWAATRATRSGEPALTPIEHTLDDAAPPADAAYWHELEHPAGAG